MTKKQEKHLKSIKENFINLADIKYRAGQKEHGGNLFDMNRKQLLDCAIEEAIDQVIYLMTLRQKLSNINF